MREETKVLALLEDIVDAIALRPAPAKRYLTFGPTRDGLTETARECLLKAAGEVAAAVVKLESPEEHPRFAELWATQAKLTLRNAEAALHTLAAFVDAELERAEIHEAALDCEIPPPARED